MKGADHIVYSINVEDIQTVALEEFGRTLTDIELEVIEENLGDSIKWYEIIEAVVTFHLGLMKKH